MAGIPAASLNALPSEMLLRVFQSCESVEQLSALWLTNKRMHSIWWEHHSVILWHAGPRIVPGFDRALMAVRATALVRDAHLRGLVPPEIGPGQLTGELRKPTLTEMREIFALHHLARCLEIRYRFTPVDDMVDYRYFKAWEQTEHIHPPQPPLTSSLMVEEEVEDPDVWKARFDQALYTFLLLGAIFTRAYTIPFLDETDSPAQRTLLERFPDDPLDPLGFRGDDMSRSEVEYLIRQYGAYNLLGTLGKHEEVFGSVASWFMGATIEELKEVGALSQPSYSMSLAAFYKKPARLFDISPRSYEWPWEKSLTSAYTGDSRAEGEAVFAAIMRAIEMYEFIEVATNTAETDAPCCRPSLPAVVSMYGRPWRIRKANVVLFGIFQVQEIWMPGEVADCSLHCLLPRLTVKDPAGFHNILDVLDFVHDHVTSDAGYYAPTNFGGGIGLPDGPAMPLAPLQFFAFLLRKYFKVQLFQTGEDGDQQHWQLIEPRDPGA